MTKPITPLVNMCLALIVLVTASPAIATTTPLTSEMSAAPTQIIQGSSTTITVKVTNSTSRQVTGDIILKIFDPNNGEVYRTSWQKKVPAQKTVKMTTIFTVAVNASVGLYTARISSTTLPLDITNATTFTVGAASSAPVEPLAHLDNESDIAKWERYVEGPSGFQITDFAQRLTNDVTAPSGDTTVFHMGIERSSSYANVYRFQRKPFVNATNFTYQVNFKWSANGGPAPQALEFPFSLYTGSERLEAAMQWVAGDGQGARWRVWGGPNAGYWTDSAPNGQPWNFYQDLAPDVWHSFSMKVTIQGGRVYYHSFMVDGQTFTVNADYAGFADRTSSQTVIAYQIDNNYFGNRQDVWLDAFTLSSQP